MATLYCFDISQVTNYFFEAFYTLCTKERQRKADKYKSIADSKRCIFAEILLKYSIYQHLGYSHDLLIHYNSYGKPFICNINNYFYNISHSGKWVLLACSDEEIGVDIEQICFTYDTIPQNFFTSEEKRYIFFTENEFERAKRFTQIWTLKESYVKFCGTGFFTDLSSFSVISSQNTIKTGIVKDGFYSKFYNCLFDENYYISLCSKKENVIIYRISLKRLLEFYHIR